MCGLINMKNDDDMCFMWCHVRHLNPRARMATTITKKDREFEMNLDYEGIDFPVKISDMDKIERKNSINISVFGYKGKKQFYPIRISKAKYNEHMELTLLVDGEVPEERKEKSENPEDQSSTDLYQTHKACSFGLKTVCHYDDKHSGEYKSYVGSDAALVFLKTVVKESFRCRNVTDKIFRKKMVITPKEEAEFLVTRNCHICGNDLCEDRVRDHDHVTVTQKGVFPYEFLDDISKLNTEGLPSREEFYSSLYESKVKEEDYLRAKKVWTHFKMKTMRDYHDLYLETDVLLLADVFENFRRTCLESYELDPAHYVSAPSLSWDAFLKKSGEEI
ncbi:Hypothetical predicted protein [Paramuricea clavata]|uniref:Uncharacterized protein n=1 Tax=Paramuricea clavata TaxID=317549 RepID=A0A6S7IWE7_PARCT|nr:Hypothetical predicted protein [Paramuricea clavata]